MYLPPEHLRGEPVDGRGDQWAWGVMTYELLTGILPWPKGVGGFQLVLAILDRMPDPPSQYVATLPSIVDATIMKTLSKSPAQRFEAMEFVVNALEGFTTSSRRSWAEIEIGATTKTDPAPPLDTPAVHTPAVITQPIPELSSGEATTLSSHKGRRLLRWPPIAALAVALAAAGTLFYGWITRPVVVSASGTLGAAAASVPASSRATLLTEPPAGTHPPEALAAYRSFQQSLRDAEWKAAIDALSTAAERDPSFAAAQLRLAFMRSLESVDEGQVRSTFMLAVRNRSTLDERDAGLLDALAPYLQSDPSDSAECERRMVELRRRWPLDAEIAYVLGSVCYDRGELSCALEAFDAALSIDPGFALAASSRGGCLAYAGRADEARAALESAAQLSRGATEPLWYLVELDEQQGRCADEEAHVRTWLSRDPSDWFGYDYLARALAAEGKPASTVLTALEQKWVRLEPDHRAKIEPIDRAYLDVATGDFVGAEQLVQELQRKLATEPGAQAHAESQALLVRVAEETGQPARARAVAEEFLARKDAWAPSHRVDEVSIFFDAVPVMLGVLARVGGLTPSALEQRRADWLGAWRAKTGAAFQGDLWIAGWADPATTPQDARAALDELPTFGGVPPFIPNRAAQAVVGRVDLLANRTDEAVDALRRGTATCTRLVDAVTNTRGWLDLGTALERRGDRAGACDAYRTVLDRWGHARPRSDSADRARQRVTALGCR